MYVSWYYNSVVNLIVWQSQIAIPIIPPETWWTRGTQRIRTGDRTGLRQAILYSPVRSEWSIYPRIIVASYNGLQVKDLGRCDLAWINQGQWSVGRLQNLIVSDYGSPLQWQSHKLALAFVESSVHSMLEVGRSGDLRFLFLLGKHCPCIQNSDY